MIKVWGFLLCNNKLRKMKKLQTYARLSLIATLTIIYHAFNSRGQFYPTIVYILTSKISLVFLLNMGLVVMYILWQLTKRVFLRSLREVEVKRLNEQSWREVMEILFALTILWQDFSITFFFAMVTIFLLIYSFFKETRMKKNRKILQK